MGWSEQSEAMVGGLGGGTGRQTVQSALRDLFKEQEDSDDCVILVDLLMLQFLVLELHLQEFLFLVLGNLKGL